jgi:uncharacterized protein
MALPRPAASSTALVTGASSGIGREISKELSRRGHGVTLVARREEHLNALAAELTAEDVRVEVIAADLSDRAARVALVQRIAGLGLTVEILVNCAGVSTLGRISRADPAAEMQMIEVDVVAMVDLCVRFLPGMVKQGQGAVLNVASTAAFQPLPGQAGYGACKAFVLSYTYSLVGELRGTGVSASALCPGPVDTGFGEAAGFDKADAEASLPKFMWKTPAAVARSGVEAMDKGRIVAIPGFSNRVGASVGYFMPRRLLLPLLAGRHPGLRTP